MFFIISRLLPSYAYLIIVTSYSLALLHPLPCHFTLHSVPLLYSQTPRMHSRPSLFPPPTFFSHFYALLLTLLIPVPHSLHMSRSPRSLFIQLTHNCLTFSLHPPRTTLHSSLHLSLMSSLPPTRDLSCPHLTRLFQKPP